MPYLRNLKVKKVSFVGRGANKREFFLAKSADFVKGEATNSNNSGGAHTMRPEVRTKLAGILKAERNIDKVCALLKEDTALAVKDEEFAEVKDFLAMIPPFPADNSEALRKAEEERDAAIAKGKSTEERLTKVEQARHRDEVKKWVTEECPYLNVKVDDAVDRIVQAETAGEAVAKILKESFKGTSDTIKSSQILKEYGQDNRQEDTIGNNLVPDVLKKLDEIKKAGGQNLKGSEAVMEAIKSVGGTRYEVYRTEFNKRAKLA